MEEQEQRYQAELKNICEKLAYVSFTNHGYDILNARNITHEDIKNFVVTMFFATYLDDNNITEVDLDVRFTVYVEAGERKNQEITFMLQDEEIINAIIEKIHDHNFGVTQKHEWTFPKPNAIQLFDAQLTLDEKLGIG